MFPLLESFVTLNMMQAQGRKSKDYLIITVDISVLFVRQMLRALLLTILWKKKDYYAYYLNDKIMAAYSNIVIP